MMPPRTLRRFLSPGACPVCGQLPNPGLLPRSDQTAQTGPVEGVGQQNANLVRIFQQQDLIDQLPGMRLAKGADHLLDAGKIGPGHAQAFDAHAQEH